MGYVGFIIDYCFGQGVSNIEACVSEVNVWMASNFLKLNADKTEVLVIGFRTQLAKGPLTVSLKISPCTEKGTS